MCLGVFDRCLLSGVPAKIAWMPRVIVPLHVFRHAPVRVGAPLVCSVRHSIFGVSKAFATRLWPYFGGPWHMCVPIPFLELSCLVFSPLVASDKLLLPRLARGIVVAFGGSLFCGLQHFCPSYLVAENLEQPVLWRSTLSSDFKAGTSKALMEHLFAF